MRYPIYLLFWLICEKFYGELVLNSWAAHFYKNYIFKNDI
jgi:hypothetical protein